MQARQPGEVIVGCYTPGAYKQVAEEHLLKSLVALNTSRGRDNRLLFIVEEIPDRGSWILNNSACQLFLREVDKKLPDDDLLYCDVDAVIHHDPWPLLRREYRGKCDIGVYYLDQSVYGQEGEELLCGTLYLPAGPKRTTLLNEWVELNKKLPDRWDQKNLQVLLEYFPLAYKVRRLPAEYCCIHDTQRKLTPDIYPVIEHFQASRKYRNR